MNYPKISIVTPNFNGEAFLEKTIESVLSQNYPNLEYIIIDGGSTDNSVAIIKKYASQLAYWISEPDKGLYDAVQKGFEKSTGEIMAWINSDDLYHPKALFAVAEIFGKYNEVNWLQGIPSIFDEMGRTVVVSEIKKWSKLDYYLGNFKWIQQESVFWRRSLWIKAGSHINIEMKYAGDLELWLRFFRHEKLYVTSALLGGFRQRSEKQLSLDFLDLYLEEANFKINEEVKCNISQEERNLIKQIKKHSILMQKIDLPLIRRIINKLFYSKLIKKKNVFYNYPSEIYFDRIKQEFKI
ncbi:glycosyltransferase family 2 protein [Flavobacterium daemonense]|uniref:glycosyltransferase family 2 protein n=1 Tax=Flavobacterium daemonense TaxID=1393049 RepID=UPI00118505AB|nr:glycosyltransferase family 2 protein [Flavobacterium daemonense]KAF2333123.1 glycosyltransferase [Flavobacterium daemonense]